MSASVMTGAPAVRATAFIFAKEALMPDSNNDFAFSPVFFDKASSARIKNTSAVVSIR